MKPRFPKTVTYTAGCFLTVVLLVASYGVYLYATYLDETYRSGSAYGFTIGQSKLEAYQIARQEFQAGKIGAIDTNRGREAEIRAHPWLQEYLSVAEARKRFHQWDSWDLWLSDAGRRPVPHALLIFEGDRLTLLGQPPKSDGPWQLRAQFELPIHEGQTRDEVLQSLEDLSRSPLYKDLRLSTGWMARREPREFAPDEFELVKATDEWLLLVGHERSYFNNIRLRFAEGRLVEIHRHRQNFELP